MRVDNVQSASPWLLSFGLVFSVATQLRLPGLPLGLGEMLLLLWLLSTLFSASNWRSPALAGVLILTMFGTLFLSAGFVLSTYPAGHTHPTAPALHDAMAYAFCAVLAINYARLADKCESSLPAMLLWAFLYSSILAFLLGVIARDWFGMDAVYLGTRWQHLSNNPNQFALLALPLPFLSLHLILRQSEKHDLFVLMLIGMLALGLGWYSQSDTLALAWMGGGLVAVLALYGKQPKPLTLTPPTKPHVRVFATLLVFLMVAGSAWQWRDVIVNLALEREIAGVPEREIAGVPEREIAGVPEREISGVPDGVCSNLTKMQKTPANADQTQASARLCLWQNALTTIKYAPLTGFGPGPHSGLSKPFDGEEAHNTLLDWGTQTGLVGAAVLVGYLVWLLWWAMRSRHYELLAMLLALYCFAMFHFMLRQPLFWIIPLLVLHICLKSGSSDSNEKLNI